MALGVQLLLKEYIFTNNLQLIPVIFIILDIDECSADSSPCDDNADCDNTDGSYSCTCKRGFTGNGTVCEGIPIVLFLAVYLIIFTCILRKINNKLFGI